MAVPSQTGEEITVALKICFYARDIDSLLSKSGNRSGPTIFN